MKLIRFIWLSTILLAGTIANSQPVVLNITSADGLPSNHIYSCTIDHNNYLWINTPKGLAKYNGYQLKIFTSANGLPTDDIWNVKEDGEGRIWILSISNELGYIKNDVYYPVIRAEGNETVYPKSTTAFKNGIFFLSPTYSSGSETATNLYIGLKDTFYKFRLNFKNDYTFILPDSLHLLTTLNGFYSSIQLHNAHWHQHRIKQYNQSDLKQAEGLNCFLFGKYLVFNAYKNKHLWVLNLPDSSRLTKLRDFNNEDIIYARSEGNRLYVTGTRNVYQKDTALNTVNVFPIDDLTGHIPVDRTKPNLLFQDPFWGNILCTETNGIFITLNFQNCFTIRDTNFLKGFVYVGRINDSVCYRWNSTTKTMAKFINNSFISFKKYPQLHTVKKVHQYDDRTLVIVDEQTVYKMDNATQTISPYLIDSPGHSMNAGYPDLFYPIDVTFEGNKTLYGIFSGVKGFYKYSPGRGRSLYHYNFTSLTYDSCRNLLWVLGKQLLFVYSLEKSTGISINLGLLKKIGIRSVEAILVDNRNGNLLLKDPEHLWNIDMHRLYMQQMFPRFRFANSIVTIYQNKLVAAGRVGVLICKMTGKNGFGKTVVYKNVKNVGYRDVNDIQIAGKTVLLSTDKGFYQVPLPQPAIITADRQRYTLLAKYNDTVTRHITNGDTLFLNAGTGKIVFDVVNPAGNGQLRFAYTPGNLLNPGESNVNELILATQPAEKFYSVTVKAFDDVWNSEPVTIILYKMPFWWQRSSTQVIFIVSGIFLLAIVGVMVFIVTRNRILTKANKRQHLVELELKAIYSQINPHFIFNTLGTALFFIRSGKTQEAYSYINKFSKLLRGYLKLSRNKFITLEEELNNLQTYIELQQGRFTNKFLYSIHIADNIIPKEVLMPSLLLQPLVENAIHHGLLNNAGAGHLILDFSLDATASLICRIEDDGIGREQARRLNEDNTLKKSSYGTTLIDDLIQTYNKYEDIVISIQYIDKSPPETGTIVIVTIKSKT